MRGTAYHIGTSDFSPVLNGFRVALYFSVLWTTICFVFIWPLHWMFCLDLCFHIYLSQRQTFLSYTKGNYLQWRPE